MRDEVYLRGSVVTCVLAEPLATCHRPNFWLNANREAT